MKIAVICCIDAGKTGQQLATALSNCTKHHVCYADQRTGRANYEKAIKGADLIWTKGDTPAEIIKNKFYLYNQRGDKHVPKASGIQVKPGVKLIMSPGGSSFRRPVHKYRKSYGFVPLERFYKKCDLVAPITPELNYQVMKGIWLPHAIDEVKYENTWERGEKVIVGAYLAQHDCKHVEKILVPAIKYLKEKKYKIDLLVTKGVSIPHKDFIKIISKCTIYFDQVNPLGVYGRSGVEAMSMGVPTICSINDTARKQALPIKDYGSPCINVHSTIDLAKILVDVMEGKVDLEKISKDSKEYAHRVHSYESIARHVENVILPRVFK